MAYCSGIDKKRLAFAVVKLAFVVDGVDSICREYPGAMRMSEEAQVDVQLFHGGQVVNNIFPAEEICVAVGRRAMHGNE